MAGPKNPDAIAFVDGPQRGRTALSYGVDTDRSDAGAGNPGAAVALPADACEALRSFALSEDAIALTNSDYAGSVIPRLGPQDSSNGRITRNSIYRGAWHDLFLHWTSLRRRAPSPRFAKWASDGSR